MALTSTEEALVRQLLDQQAAILSLAGNESTITSKLGATKVTLADLVAASSLADADLLLTRQGTNDKSLTAALLAQYCSEEFLAGITTPPQFDNDTSLATTAFVQRALGSSRGAIGVSSNLTLSGAEVGMEIVFGANNVTLTLPDSSAFQTGATYLVDVGSASGITLASAGSQILRLNNVDTLSTTKRASIPLGQMSTFKIVNLGGGTWGVSEYGGIASLSSNGYQKLPSGLIIQWGSSATSASSNVTVTFPIAFPTDALSRSLVVLSNGPYVLWYESGSASSMSIGGTNLSGTRVAFGFGWIAIGY